MKRISIAMLMLLVIGGLLVGCGKGWEMDYGTPAAQFLQEDLESKAQAFVGKKITIKGTVTKVDITVPGSAKVYLAGGIQCNLGGFRLAAESCKVGDTVYMDGFLERCEAGDVLLAPAFPRDPTAPFSPNR